jgi:hypothetical protein
MTNDASPGTNEALEAVCRELIRRGMPEFLSFGLLTWPLGLLTYGTSAMYETGIPKEAFVDVIEIVVDGRWGFVSDTVDAITEKYGIDCECGYADCHRGFYKISQMCHAIVTAFDSLIGLTDISDEDVKQYEETNTGPYAERIASVKSCLEFLTMFLVNSGMPLAFSS